jgi:hypothetical protein
LVLNASQKDFRRDLYFVTRSENRKYVGFISYHQDGESFYNWDSLKYCFASIRGKHQAVCEGVCFGGVTPSAPNGGKAGVDAWARMRKFPNKYNTINPKKFFLTYVASVIMNFV